MISLVKARHTDVADHNDTCPYILKYGRVLDTLFHKTLPKVFYLDADIPSEHVQYIITAMSALLFSSHWDEILITHKDIYDKIGKAIGLNILSLPLDSPYHIQLVWIERLLVVFVEACTYNKPLANVAMIACLDILSEHYSATIDIGRYNNWIRREAIIFNTTKQVTGRSDIGILKRGVISILDSLGALKMDTPLDTELSQLFSVIQGVAIQWVYVMSDTFNGKLQSSAYVPKMKYLTSIQVVNM